MVRLLNIAILLLWQLIFDNVQVTQQFPSEIQAGTPFRVDIEISKGEVEGFGYLIQDLPEGYTASVIETRNASFSFHKGNLKFMWYTLPDDAVFTVSYEVTPPLNAKGDFTLGGSFNYLVNNDKQVAQLPVKTAVITGKSATASADPAGALQVTCSRSIDLSRLDRFREIIVTLRINKGDIGGFAKVLETMPDGFVPSPIETGTASFSFVDQQARFFWLALPASPEITLQYKITVDEHVTGTFFLNGEFSYLVDNLTSKCLLPRESIAIGVTTGTEDVASDTTTETESEQTPEPEETETEIAETTQPVQQTEEPASPPVNQVTEKTETKEEPPVKKAEPVSPAPPVSPKTVIPETGVRYKVQIAASRKQVSPSYFSKKFRVSEPIAAEMHEGWNKFTIGSYTTYRLARDKREETRNTHTGLISPFVTAYNNGHRITVQEALMISNQKWVR